eukprot:PhM_4_TR6773/c0_g1_i1/m.27597
MFRRSVASRCHFFSKLGDIADVRPASYHLLYNSITSWKHAVVTMDCEYNNTPMSAASYLLWSRHNDHTHGMFGAFIDNNTNHALPVFDKELANTQKNSELTWENIKYVIVTHIHLDHAGATGALLERCPNATVLCHPRATRHLVDPSYLIRAVKDVYGEEEYRRMYGDILPCPKDRVRAMADGETVSLTEGRPLTFHHVEGHAKHHVAIHDVTTNSVFTGDAFGLRYPWVQLYNVRETFFFPSSSPTDFNAAAARKAIDKIVSLKPRRIFPTHFGACEEIDIARDQMMTALDVYEGIQRRMAAELKKGTSDNDIVKMGEAEMRSYIEKGLRDRGLFEDDEDFWSLYKTDINLNAQGLLVAAKRNPDDLPPTNSETHSTTTSISSPTSETVTATTRANPTATIPTTTTDAADAENSQKQQTNCTTNELTTAELKRLFESVGLERLCGILQSEEIDGAIFCGMSAEDLTSVFGDLTFGARQRLLNLQKQKKR